MDKKEIILKSKRGFFSNLVGNHTSIFAGSGIEFKDIKEYSSSDSARHINWKKSTQDSIKVNSFSEDRELNIVLVYLNSGSLEFAGKKQTAIEVLTSLSFAAIYSKESLSTIFFNNSNSYFFKPTKKQAAIDINYDFAKRVKYQDSIDYDNLNRYLLQHIKKRSVVFIIGDFLDEVDLKVISSLHEVYAIIIRTKEEEELTLSGELNIVDTNSSSQTLLTINRRSQKLYNKKFKEQDFRLFKELNSCQIVYTKIYTYMDSVKELVNFTRKLNG